MGGVIYRTMLTLKLAARAATTVCNGFSKGMQHPRVFIGRGSSTLELGFHGGA